MAGHGPTLQPCIGVSILDGPFDGPLPFTRVTPTATAGSTVAFPTASCTVTLTLMVPVPSAAVVKLAVEKSGTTVNFSVVFASVLA